MNDLHEARETEAAFWIAWRIRWLPKLIAAGVFAVVGTIANCAMDYAAINLRYRAGIAADNAKPRTVVPHPTDSLIASRAKVMGPYCDFKVNQKTISQAQTESWWNSDQTDPVSGLTFDCSHWMWYAGIR